MKPPGRYSATSTAPPDLARAHPLVPEGFAGRVGMPTELRASLPGIDHPSRSATSGLTRVARHAGTTQAIATTTSSTTGTAMKLAASCVEIP